MDYCQLCRGGPFSTTFEFRYSVRGGGGEVLYVREACSCCTLKLTRRDPVYCSREHWQENRAAGKNTYDVYLRYGIIDDYHLDYDTG